MSDEELNKKMEFIVEQQAQFTADIQVMREVQAQDSKLFKEQYRKLSDAVIVVVGMIGNLTKSTDEGFKLLTQAQTRTEDRLNAFIDVVERHISGNGGSQSPA